MSARGINPGTAQAAQSPTAATNARPLVLLVDILGARWNARAR